MTQNSQLAKKISPLNGELPIHCQEDLASLKNFVRVKIQSAPLADAVSPCDMQHVLLTGATGFLGRFLARDLLQTHPSITVHCLIRANSVEEANQRLQDSFIEAKIWDPAYQSRIQVIPGDITQEKFGLNVDEFLALSKMIDAVYHLAANLSLATNYSNLRETNTLSIRNVIEMCLTVRFKHLFYASSMGVFPEYMCRFTNEFTSSYIDDEAQPDVALMKRHFPPDILGYPWSKLVAEQALLYAQSFGLPLALFRLPLTGNSSVGFTQAGNILVQFLGAMFDVNMIMPNSSMQVNVEPADTLSKICVAICANPNRQYTIYHCCDTRTSTRTADLAEIGIYLEETSFRKFKRACLTRGTQSPVNGSWLLLDRFAPYWFSQEKLEDSIPISDRSINVDCTFSIKWPSHLSRFIQSSEWVSKQGDKWPYPLPKSQLNIDKLVSQAEKYAARWDLQFKEIYSDLMIEGLDNLIKGLNSPSVHYLSYRRGLTVLEMNRLLRENAAFVSERKHNPMIDDERICQPIFIVGINRTGTTLLHRLLSRDDNFLTLKTYELFDTALPDGDYLSIASSRSDPRRTFTMDAIDDSGIGKLLAGIHEIEVDEPEEDYKLLKLSFASWLWTVIFDMPNYAEWLENTGADHAYKHHYGIMQHFNWRRRNNSHTSGTKSWLFKMPFHLMELEALIDTYPDAMFIQTHRSPIEFMGSWISLVNQVRSMFLEPKPLDEITSTQITLMSHMLERAIQFRSRHPELENRWIDISFSDLVADPKKTVQSIYERVNRPLEQHTLETMDRWLHTQAERRKSETRHDYKSLELELAEGKIGTKFDCYIDFVDSLGIKI